ncbi:MAG: fimbrillin family protein [Bacteroidales bacterium]|nr:fimbrillin family protein [Bacteroidales bacterium]
MKKSVFMAALASLMLASCTFEEDRVKQTREIDFSVAPYAVQTKTEHDLNTAFTNPFRVWAWDADNANAVIDGKVANYQNGSGTWSVEDGPYYWPDFGLEFVAVVPATGNNYCQVNRSADGNTSIVYTFDALNENPRTINLMHSDFTDKLTAAQGTVNLGFRHALANVNVVVKQGTVTINPEDNIVYYEVELNAMSVEGIHRQGTYTVNSNAQNISNQVWTYEPSSPTSEIPYLSTGSKFSLNPGNVAQNYEPNDGNDIFVMPQHLDDNAKFVIDYTVITHTTSGTTTGTPKHVEVQLNTIAATGSGTTINAWHTNKKIQYTINIMPKAELNGIQFSVSEEEWGTVSGSFDTAL